MGKQVKKEKKRKVYTLNQVGMAMAFYNEQTERALSNCYHEKPEKLPKERRINKDQMIGMFMNLTALQTLCISMLQMGLKDTTTIVPNEVLDPLLDMLVTLTVEVAKRYEEEYVAMVAGFKMGIDKTIN